MNIDKLADKVDEVWNLCSHTKKLEVIKHVKKKCKIEILTNTKYYFLFIPLKIS